MQEENHDIKTLLTKYQQGKVNQEEKQLISEWLFQLDLKENKISNEEIKGLSDRSMEDLRSLIEPSIRKKQIKFFNRFQAIAASILLVLGLSLWLIYSNYLKISEKDEQLSLIEVSTLFGEQKIIMLPDSSQITLNSLSRLKFPKQFDKQNREVFLEGEAFFDVKRNPSKPFIIQADSFDVEVLGTSFNIKAYSEDNIHSISVRTGKVSITNSTGQENLTAGEHLTIDKVSGRFSKESVVVEDVSAWKEGRLVFENENLEAITKTLERRYGVEIEFKTDKVKTKVINLTIAQQSLTTVLDALQLTAGFKYSQKGRKIMIW